MSFNTTVSNYIQQERILMKVIKYLQQKKAAQQNNLQEMWFQKLGDVVNQPTAINQN